MIAHPEIPPVTPSLQREAQAYIARCHRNAAQPKTTARRAAARVPIDPTIRESALRRYEEEQLLTVVARKRRKQLKYTGRRDVAFLHKWGKRAINLYDMATSFLMAHGKGVVSRRAKSQRAAYCAQCTFRRRREAPNLASQPVAPGTPLDWRDRCAGYQPGESCDCLDDPIWRPAKLLHMLGLWMFKCPLGHFDRGNAVPSMDGLTVVSLPPFEGRLNRLRTRFKKV